MLNLSIVMFRAFLLFLLFQDPTVSIASPQTGMTVRGQVEILGTMNVPNFASAELAFGFVDAAGDAWFTIQTFPQPKVDPPLAVWDTTSITDGDYNLRLRVVFQDGSFQDSVVTGVKIRNDLPEPTATPTQDLQPISSAVALVTTIPATPSRLSFAQPTSLPSNPAALTTPQVYATFGRGAFIALGLFVILSFLLRLRKD
jgi:hypothetical protein